MLWSKYGKSLTAGLILVVTAVQAALSDSQTAGRISQVEVVQIAIAATTALSVYLAPNVPQWPTMKTVLAGLLAALQLAVTLIVDGMGSADWSALILAALTAVSVGLAPAESDPAITRPAGARR